jgi:hypothetical protein
MNARPVSPLLRPLRVLALLLAVAIAVLFVLWIDREPPPVAAAPIDGVGSAPTPGAAVAASLPAPAATPAATTAAETPAATAAGPAERGVLFGSVRRADGSAVTDGYLWLSRASESSGSAALRGTGTFAFAGLRPGTYRLTSRIPDELPLDREVRVEAPATRLDVELDARWLLQVDAVTADGKPLRDAIARGGAMALRSVRPVAMREPLTGDLLVAVRTDGDAGVGSLRANDPFMDRGQKALPKQTIGVLALPPGEPVHVALVYGNAVLAQQPATPGQETMTFVVAPDALETKSATVRLRCVDGNGAPIAGLRVSVGSGNGMSFGGEKQITDADGRFVASGLMPGEASFHVFQKELRSPPLRLDVAAGDDVDLGDVVLRAAVEIELSFDGFGGKGSVRSSLLDVPPGARWRSAESYTSEGDGPAKLVLYPGRHALFARGANGIALLEVDTAALPAGPLRFELRRGASLQIDNRAPDGFVRYAIATTRGARVAGGDLTTRRGFAHELPPGEYRVTVQTGAGTPQQRTLTLPPGGATLTLP